MANVRNREYTSSAQPVQVRTRIERKSPSLPRFIVVASEALSNWDIEGTTVVDARINGVDIGRRSLKYWGRNRYCWFLDVTESQCASAAVETGDSVILEVRIASTRLPAELETVIGSDGAASEVWTSLTSSQKRQLAEHVRAAKRPDTRLRRARRALLDAQ